MTGAHHKKQRLDKTQTGRGLDKKGEDENQILYQLGGYVQDKQTNEVLKNQHEAKWGLPYDLGWGKSSETGIGDKDGVTGWKWENGAGLPGGTRAGDVARCKVTWQAWVEW